LPKSKNKPPLLARSCYPTLLFPPNFPCSPFKFLRSPDPL
jgi:hypothetical protein